MSRRTDNTMSKRTDNTMSRRTDNTMSRRKRQKAKNIVQNTTHKSKDQVTLTLQKTRGELIYSGGK
jgi:hypothetical protein